MNSNNMLKILCSLPVILLFLYFVPLVGVCLIVLRCFTYRGSKKQFISNSLIIIGILILIPRIVGEVVSFLKQDIHYLNDVLASDIYIKLFDYSKFILIIGIILLIVSAIFKAVSNKISNIASSYLNNYQKEMTEVSKQNDMEIKLKQERAKTTRVVYCSNCGADNIVTEKVGKCKYCRQDIQ